MLKDFNDFIKTNNFEELSKDTYNSIVDQLGKYDDETKIAKISYEVSLKILEEYHNWLNA